MTEKQWVRKPGQDVLGSTPRLVYAVPPVLQCLKHAGKTPPVVYSVLLKVTVDISLASFPIVLILGDNWALIVLKDWASQCPRTWWLFFSKSIRGKIQNLLFYKTELETIIRAWKTFQTELQSNTIMKFNAATRSQCPASPGNTVRPLLASSPRHFSLYPARSLSTLISQTSPPTTGSGHTVLFAIPGPCHIHSHLWAFV